MEPNPDGIRKKAGLKDLLQEGNSNVEDVLRQKQENLAVAAEDAADRRLLQDHYHDLHHLYTLD